MRSPIAPTSAHTPWLAVALVAGAILVLSVIPIPGSVPEEGGGVPTSVLFHFLGYATMAPLLAFSSLTRDLRVRPIATGLLGTSAYGVLIECLQYPIPYRSFSYLDMLVNGAGATAGTVVLLCVLSLSLSDDRG